MGIRRFKLGIALVLSVALVLTGCNASENTSNSVVSSISAESSVAVTPAPTVTPTPVIYTRITLSNGWEKETNDQNDDISLYDDEGNLIYDNLTEINDLENEYLRVIQEEKCGLVGADGYNTGIEYNWVDVSPMGIVISHQKEGKTEIIDSETKEAIQVLEYETKESGYCTAQRWLHGKINGVFHVYNPYDMPQNFLIQVNSEGQERIISIASDTGEIRVVKDFDKEKYVFSSFLNHAVIVERENGKMYLEGIVRELKSGDFDIIRPIKNKDLYLINYMEFEEGDMGYVYQEIHAGYIAYNGEPSFSDSLGNTWEIKGWLVIGPSGFPNMPTPRNSEEAAEKLRVDIYNGRLKDTGSFMTEEQFKEVLNGADVSEVMSRE